VTDDLVARIRQREYPEEPEGIFMNAASWGLVPRSAAEEAASLTLRKGRIGGFQEEELGRIQRRCRSAIALLLGVEASEIALAPNTSFGVNLAAALVSRGRKGRILVSQGEFPANVLPWVALEARGFTVEVVPTGDDGLPDEPEIVRRLDAEDVRVLAVSAVQYASGHKADLSRLGRACRERSVLFCIDAIQALGATPLDAREVHADVVASGGQKWLCAPWGSGFVYVRKELHERFDPPMVSWLSQRGAMRLGDRERYALDWRGDARKFELATLGVQDYLGLARSVEVLLEIGIERILRHIHSVHEPLLDWIDGHPDVTLLTPRDPGQRAGIVSFVTPSTEESANALAEAGVVCGVRAGALRLAPHFYNTPEEMAKVVSVLERTV
jgi:cysteine desulfurase/selenocysteine lyase